MMTFDGYQDFTRTTAIYQGAGGEEGLPYVVLGLNGEAGEVAEKVKKLIRDGALDRDAISKELGDVLWYLAQTAFCLGISLGDVAAQNVTKLQGRMDRGVLQGSGDNR